MWGDAPLAPSPAPARGRKGAAADRRARQLFPPLSLPTSPLFPSPIPQAIQRRKQKAPSPDGIHGVPTWDSPSASLNCSRPFQRPEGVVASDAVRQKSTVEFPICPPPEPPWKGRRAAAGSQPRGRAVGAEPWCPASPCSDKDWRPSAPLPPSAKQRHGCSENRPPAGPPRGSGRTRKTQLAASSPVSVPT